MPNLEHLLRRCNEQGWWVAVRTDPYRDNNIFTVLWQMGEGKALRRTDTDEPAEFVLNLLNEFGEIT